MIIRTHMSVRLGDSLAHLHFLRKLAAVYPEHRFIHYAHLTYLPQLVEVVADLMNVQVMSLESTTDDADPKMFWEMAPRPLLVSIDAWKNAGGYWQNHPQRTDYAEFMIQHFRRLAKQMGLESPIVEVADLLFDYPALKVWEFPPFDMLVINSAPQSGQMPGYDPSQTEMLVGELNKRHQIVTTARTPFNCPCTMGKAMTVSQIGALSRFCKYVVGFATGPIWPTLNVFNRDSVEFRLMLIGDERLNFGGKTEHAANVFEARKLLQLEGLL